MAMSSTPSCMTHSRDLMPSILLLNPKYNHNTIPNFLTLGRTKPSPAAASCRLFRVRSSSDDAATTASSSTVTEEESWNQESDSPAEVPQGPPSLISALNVQKALRGIAITDVDHYGRLGLRIGCSYDQVRDAYEKKMSEVSSQELDEEELTKKLDLLKESYAILSSEEERRLYDWSLARNENPERYTWPFEVDLTQTPKWESPPPQEPENVGPTRLVGYFILGWLVLGFTLSIALNQ